MGEPVALGTLHHVKIVICFAKDTLPCDDVTAVTNCQAASLDCHMVYWPPQELLFRWLTAAVLWHCSVTTVGQTVS